MIVGLAPRRAAAGLAVALAGLLVAAGCGGGEAAPPTVTASPVAAPRATPLGDALALVPDVPALRRQVLFGDLRGLRHAYGEIGEVALAGVWLPDALAAADRAPWRTVYGAGLGRVESFVSAGFHPAEVAVAVGRFPQATLERLLARRGFARRNGLLARGADGSLDASTPTGRVVLSALDRVAIEPGRIVGASTTRFARRALASDGRRLADRADFAAAARAIDPVTAAVVLDASLVRPPSGVPVRVVATRPASLVAAGVLDRGEDGGVLELAIVYENEVAAEEEAGVLEQALPTLELTAPAGRRLVELGSDWAVEAVGRAVLVTARVAPGDHGAWRSLVESGDLAVLIRPGA
ncbi:MAG: hypothetical protein R3C15_23790 [Thermoleophilia bacterium]